MTWLADLLRGFADLIDNVADALDPPVPPPDEDHV